MKHPNHRGPNRYYGRCCRCGEPVLPGEGEIAAMSSAEREAWLKPHDRTSLKVQHHECAKKWEGTTHHWNQR